MEKLIVFGLVLILSFMAIFSFLCNRKIAREKLRRKEKIIIAEMQCSNGKCFVNYDAEPLEIDGYSVISHDLQGSWFFNPGKVSYLFGDEVIGGNKVCKIFKKCSSEYQLNDFTLKNETIVPSNYPADFFCFGIVYSRKKDGLLFIRALIPGDGNKLTSCLRPINKDFHPEEVLIFKN